MKRLYDVLKTCKKEEEVKSEFAKFFKFKINADGLIDHYTKSILHEFKLDKNFKNIKNISAVIAQTMYYARYLKYGRTANPLPPFIFVIDKNEAFFFETAKYKKFYTSTSDKYDWDRAASCPCPKLITDIEKFDITKNIHVYSLQNETEEELFIKYYNTFSAQQTTFAFSDKKSINEDNFFDVYKYWSHLFGKYVENGRKASEYFLSDIEIGKSNKFNNNQIAFDLGDGNAKLKTLPIKDYDYFWSIYDKVESKDIFAIRQKVDRISNDYERRFTGEFYTPVEYAEKGLKYLEKVIGKNWWKSGEYRFWDMAAGTGNLEFKLPESALKYCYISTLLEDDANYCKRIFPSATCFQYDYLNDDIGFLGENLNLEFIQPKMPKNLIEDLKNPNLKWIIFINPPFATSQKSSREKGHDSKIDVSKTAIRQLMTKENLGAASRELFTQFIYRLSKEFNNKNAYLGLFSTLKYINYKNDQKVRDSFFKYKFENGFIFPSKQFHGAKGNFPIGFAIWNLNNSLHLEKQKITFDVFNENYEKYGTKHLNSINEKYLLNEWIIDKKQKAKNIYPPFASAINISVNSFDTRDRITDNFIFSLMSVSPDYQHSNYTALLSGPYSSAGGYSVTPYNFEKAMIIHCVRKNIVRTWSNDKDLYYLPNSDNLSEEFVIDCIVWSAFADSNNTVSLKDVKYKNKIYQIKNNLYPYLLKEVKTWECPMSDISLQIASANEDRFLAAYLGNKTLSQDATIVLNDGKQLYKYFYKEICNTRWLDYKIQNWDVGLWQIKQALKQANIGAEEIENLKAAHKKLSDKLLPQLYSYGFLQEDVIEFECV